jgi:hypothetical protein
MGPVDSSSVAVAVWGAKLVVIRGEFFGVKLLVA